MTISTGGKVCIFIGSIFVLGAIFLVSNPIIALFSLIAGISCMVQGAHMKASIPTTRTNWGTVPKSTTAVPKSSIIGKGPVQSKDTRSRQPI